MGRQSLIFSGFIQSTYFFPFFFFLGMYRRMAFSSIVVMIQLFAIIIYPSSCAPPGSSFAGKKEFKGSRLKRSFPCQIEMNTGYHHGHDIKEVAGIESIAECQDQCHKHSPPCVGFTWNELGKICHPKEKMSDKKPGQFFFHSGICNAIDDDEGSVLPGTLLDVKYVASEYADSGHVAKMATKEKGGYWCSKKYPKYYKRLPLYWWIMIKEKPVKIVSIAFDEYDNSKYNEAEFTFFWLEILRPGSRKNWKMLPERSLQNAHQWSSGQDKRCGVRERRLLSLLFSEDHN